MQFRTHLITTMAISLPIMTTTDTLAIGTIAAVSLGALFPDIDEPHSWIGSRTRGVSDLINKAFGHRGMTHSLVAIFVVFLTILLMINILNFPTLIGMYFVFGYALHLVQDSFSKSGIKWLLPFNTTAYQSGLKIIYYRTGSMVEKFILLAATILVIVQIPGVAAANILEQVSSWFN